MAPPQQFLLDQGIRADPVRLILPPSFQDKHGAEGKVCLGFCVQGIVVYSLCEDVKTQLHHCPWQKIKDISFAVSRILDQIVAV